MSYILPKRGLSRRGNCGSTWAPSSHICLPIESSDLWGKCLTVLKLTPHEGTLGDITRANPIQYVIKYKSTKQNWVKTI